MQVRNLVVDAVALVVYALAANPSVTGIGVHEWVGLGLAVLLLAHCALHAGWVADAVPGAVRRPSWTRTGNLLLDAVSFAAFAVVTVSGVLVSGAVLPAFGLYADGYYFWDPLHAISAKVLLALLLVHLVAHGRWLGRIARLLEARIASRRIR